MNRCMKTARSLHPSPSEARRMACGWRTAAAVAVWTLVATNSRAVAQELWLQRHFLYPADAQSDDEFGSAVAVQGQVSAITARLDDDTGSNAGSVYLYDLVTGEQLHKLNPGDPVNSKAFGSALAIDGGLLLIGAYLDWINGIQSGSAYVFDIATGEELRKFVPHDGEYQDRFGRAVALRGNLALIGSPDGDGVAPETGAAYLYDVTTGDLIHKFFAPDGAHWDRFGFAVALSDRMALIGANQADAMGEDSGAAYVFDLQSGDFLHKLTPDDGVEDDHFGISVAVEADRGVVGAHFGDDKKTGPDCGTAYVFNLDTGAQIHKLVDPQGTPGAFFGWAVGFSGERIVVGAFHDDPQGSSSGSAHVFDASTGLHVQELYTTNGEAGDYFGEAVAIGGDWVVVGARHHEPPNGLYNTGAAYAFARDTYVSMAAAGVCPGTVRVSWNGARPSTTLGLVLARAPGEFVIPSGPCAGFRLGLGSDGIQLISTFGSGINGSGQRSGFAGEPSCRRYLQIVELPGCRTSNVVRIP